MSPLALACLQDGAGGEGSLGRTGRRCDADSAVVRQNRGRDVNCDHSTVVNTNSMKCVHLDQTLKTSQAVGIHSLGKRLTPLDKYIGEK